MIRTTAIIIALYAGNAAAHPGHLAKAAGHSHWELLGGLAVIAIAGAAVWKALATR